MIFKVFASREDGSGGCRVCFGGVTSTKDSTEVWIVGCCTREIFLNRFLREVNTNF